MHEDSLLYTLSNSSGMAPCGGDNSQVVPILSIVKIYSEKKAVPGSMAGS